MNYRAHLLPTLRQWNSTGNARIGFFMESRPTVLVVEDNKTEQKLLTFLLERYGYRAQIAADAASAIEAFERDNGNFCLILMDWQMHDMDGLECTQRVREVQKHFGRYTPIVAVTARAMLDDRQKCLASGMDDYLSKPYTPAQFANMLTTWASVQGDRSLIG